MRYDPKKSLGTIVRCHPNDKSRASYGSFVVDLSPNGLAAVKEGVLKVGFSVMELSEVDERCPGCHTFANDDSCTISCFCDSISKRYDEE